MPESNISHSTRRAIILIIDGCGIGASPDYAAFGDRPDCNSIGNTARAVGGLKLPNLQRIGLGNIADLAGVPGVASPTGIFGKLRERSNSKDTQTGHWEMMGIVSTTPFRTYPQGFPEDVVERFVRETGCKGILCNEPASGTEVIEKFGPEHQKTGMPIVYTSGDSVFQLAVHVDTVPLATMYQWCEIARHIMQGPHLIGRIIARPFNGTPGNYKRMSFERRDYGMKPPQQTFMDVFQDAGAGVLGIGKIEDIFDRQGLSHALHTGANKEGLDLTVAAVRQKFDLKSHAIIEQAPDSVQLIFTNLVDTDALYGHRRNVDGYAKALEEIDGGIGEIIDAMGEGDLLIVSSDHGNDPTAPGTDHTREYVPLVAYSKSLHSASGLARDIGERDGFMDMAASLGSWFAVDWRGHGKSFIPQMTGVAQ